MGRLAIGDAIPAMINMINKGVSLIWHPWWSQTTDHRNRGLESSWQPSCPIENLGCQFCPYQTWSLRLWGDLIWRAARYRPSVRISWAMVELWVRRVVWTYLGLLGMKPAERLWMLKTSSRSRLFQDVNRILDQATSSQNYSNNRHIYRPDSRNDSFACA